jgi:hypothetical protein
MTKRTRSELTETLQARDDAEEMFENNVANFCRGESRVGTIQTFAVPDEK